MNAPIDKVLAQIPDARQMQSGQYAARCPAHGGKKQNLTIRETPEGAVLIHCFAGCNVVDVVAAMALDMSDLFPPREPSGREPKRTSRLLTAGQALELIDREANLIAVAGANLGNGVTLNEIDLTRVLTAAGRISWVHKECMRGHNA